MFVLIVLSSFFSGVFPGEVPLLLVLEKDFEDSKSESLELDSEGLGDVLALSLKLSTF